MAVQPGLCQAWSETLNKGFLATWLILFISGVMEVKRSDGSVLCVGDRVESDGFTATVKYIGAVTRTKGTCKIQKHSNKFVVI